MILSTSAGRARIKLKKAQSLRPGFFMVFGAIRDSRDQFRQIDGIAGTRGRRGGRVQPEPDSVSERKPVIGPEVPLPRALFLEGNRDKLEKIRISGRQSEIK